MANNTDKFKPGDLVELHLLTGFETILCCTGVVLEHARQEHYPFADGLRIHWTDGTVTVQEVGHETAILKLKARA
jgi:hypothetical protein